MDSRNVFSAKAPENRLLWNILWWLGGQKAIAFVSFIQAVDF